MPQREPSRMHPGYEKYTPWTVLPKEDKSWTEVATEDEGSSFNVHINPQELRIFFFLEMFSFYFIF